MRRKPVIKSKNVSRKKIEINPVRKKVIKKSQKIESTDSKSLKSRTKTATIKRTVKPKTSSNAVKPKVTISKIAKPKNAGKSKISIRCKINCKKNLSLKSSDVTKTVKTVSKTGVVRKPKTTRKVKQNMIVKPLTTKESLKKINQRSRRQKNCLTKTIES